MGSEVSKFASKDISIEDILYYRSKNLSTTEIAKLTGCDHSNIVRRLQSVKLQSLQNFSTYKDQVFEHKQREVLNSLTDVKIKAMSGLQAITGAAILEDKIRIIRGQATDIVDHRVLQVDMVKAVQLLRQEQSQDKS
jgi:hypothetical protein